MELHLIRHKEVLVPRDPRLGDQFAMAMVGLADATETDAVVHGKQLHAIIHES